MPATLLVQARWALVPKNLLLEYTPPPRSRGKSLRSTDQLLNGRLTSATAESNTVLSKRAPANVLLAVLEAHPSVTRCVFFTRV